MPDKKTPGGAANRMAGKFQRPAETGAGTGALGGLLDQAARLAGGGATREPGPAAPLAAAAPTGEAAGPFVHFGGEIPAALKKRFKLRAAELDRTIKDVLTEALQEWMERHAGDHSAAGDA